MKSLETEYRDAISLELPDLWSRIEAGVDEYEANKKNEKITYINKKEETETEKEADPVIKKIHRKNTISNISRFVAAAACLILAIGAFRMIGGSKSSNSATAMSDAAVAYEASDAAASCDAASEEASYEKAEEAVAQYSSDESAVFDEAPAAAVEAEAEEGTNADANKNTLSAETDEKRYTKAGDTIRVDDQMTKDISEALECEMSDATKIALQLSVIGIKDPVGFEAVEEMTELTQNNEVKTNENELTYGFTDEATGDKYLMIINKAEDGTFKLVSVIKNDDTKEVIYEENKAE
ncbi:MAG: hypothetical protein J5525_14550 [Lachnospiraceae bacterium]|nr:hypothetical protein [Lachnospiraceae bacterium]